MPEDDILSTTQFHAKPVAYVVGGASNKLLGSFSSWEVCGGGE